METCLTCQRHKAGVTSCTLLPRPHGSFLPKHPPGKVSRNSRVSSIRPTKPCSGGTGVFFPGIGGSGAVPPHARAQHLCLVAAGTALAARTRPVSGTGQHATDREIHVSLLEVFKVISYELRAVIQKPCRNPAGVLGRAVGTPGCPRRPLCPGHGSAPPPPLAWGPPRRGQRLVYKSSLCTCDKKGLADSARFLSSLLASHPAGCLSWEPVALSEWICFQTPHGKGSLSPLLATSWQP